MKISTTSFDEVASGTGDASVKVKRPEVGLGTVTGVPIAVRLASVNAPVSE